MNVKSLNCVQVGSFLVVLRHLHNVVYVTEGMCFFIKVFCENGCVAIGTEGSFVLIVLYNEASFGLSNICLFLQSGQLSLYTPDNENLSGGGLFHVSRFPTVFLVQKAILRSVHLNTLVM